MAIQAVDTGNAQVRLGQIPHLDGPIGGPGKQHALPEIFHEHKAADATFVVGEHPGWRILRSWRCSKLVCLPSTDLAICQPQEEEVPLWHQQHDTGFGSVGS
eukprot:CAMPEP_0206515262 /NCGR_PEP_ID=MMETSP0324_2-20121206/62676_1 /ASSEMBLY_ACC=CAM_ASM_000836 /TAXON_ID=2866 /ORGANISM="Crypthecodinium cohnii, Strain Seligo" /LENGTH=101 /DNA_ID=CAMNT_0054007989 /DNA_START=55 /DNA_END=357 /DNA_ORIENTATION=-